MKKLFTILYIFLLLSPYYVFSSGTPQPGNFILLFGLPILFLIFKSNKERISKIFSKNIFFVLFFISILSINSLYFLYYGDLSFIKSNIYYIFNFIVVILFAFSLEDSNFRINLVKIMKINIILQLLIFFSPIGRYYQNVRYMGTFNDPNQFAYFIFISLSFIFLENKDSTLVKTVFTLISTFLIFNSGSTGMLLGVSVLTLGLIIVRLRRLPANIQNKKRQTIGLSVLATVILCLTGVSAILFFGPSKLPSQITDNSIMGDRIKSKLSKADNKKGSLLQERGYDRIYNYPIYVLFGSGEGNYSRWTKIRGQEQELHATLPSVLFCYGVIPLIFLLLWLKGCLRKMSPRQWIIYGALLLESFTLLNIRQSLFWIIFIFASYSVNNVDKVNSANNGRLQNRRHTKAKK